MSKINTKTTSSEVEGLYNNVNVERHKDVTGTDVGVRRGLDTFTLGSISHIIDLANLLIKGSEPEVNYNRIIQSGSGSSLTLAFVYDGSVQFYIDGTTIYSTPDIQFRTTSNLNIETALSALLKEDGDNITLEG